MRVFVTGAAGFIGQATVKELIKNGHQVLGLARSVASMEALTKAGAQPHKGDLKDLESLKSGAQDADGVIHLAFIHDFTDYVGACATDRAAIEAMGSALAGTGKPLIIASGTLTLVASTTPDSHKANPTSFEDTEPLRDHPMSDRVKSEELIHALSKEKQVRGIQQSFS